MNQDSPSYIDDNLVIDNNHFGLRAEPRKCDIGRGLIWLVESFNIFKEKPLLWLGVTFSFTIVFLILNLIPIINLIASLLLFHFISGFIIISAQQKEDIEPTFRDMFSALESHFVPLFILSVIYIAFNFIALIPLFVIAGFSFIDFFINNSDIGNFSASSFLLLMLGILIYFTMYIPIIMAVYMAPSLIVLHDIKTIDAIKMSFKGCIKNILPLTILGFLGLFLVILVSAFTLGLGLILLLPIMMISYYTCYRDIWSEKMIDE